jgi:hypothetical protein
MAALRALGVLALLAQQPYACPADRLYLQARLAGPAGAPGVQWRLLHVRANTQAAEQLIARLGKQTAALRESSTVSGGRRGWGAGGEGLRPPLWPLWLPGGFSGCRDAALRQDWCAWARSMPTPRLARPLPPPPPQDSAMHRLCATLRVHTQLLLRDPNNPHSTASEGGRLGRPRAPGLAWPGHRRVTQPSAEPPGIAFMQAGGAAGWASIRTPPHTSPCPPAGLSRRRSVCARHSARLPPAGPGG